MERAMACRTEEEIRRLFCVEASDYWRTHHIPGIAGDDRPKRLGAFKANIIGINLVSVLQFAYGSYTGREALRDSAPDAARTPARGGQPLHARLARRGANAPQRFRVAGPVATGDGILRPPNGARSAPSDGAS